MSSRAALLALGLGPGLGLAAACGGGRDVVPETRDVRSENPNEGVTHEGGYDYVARRPRAIVALAEGRGIDRVIAVAATDRVADQMESCAEDLAQKGQLVRGAARVAARIGDDGNLAGIAVKIAPGAAVAANAILCFIAPVKTLTFPATTPDGGAPAAPVDRGFALEATWEP